MKRVLLTLMLVPFAGCLDLFDSSDPFDRPLDSLDFDAPAGARDADDITWPDLSGATLDILDHGAFPVCTDAGERFTELTGAEVTCTSEEDTGSALNRAVRDAGDPEFDIIYGIDNVLLQTALDGDVLEAYTPQLAARVPEAYRFFEAGHDDHDHEHDWPATPVDHGYIAINVDHLSPLLDTHEQDGCPTPKATTEPDNATTVIADLSDVRAAACLFVTQDPRLSTPGLGFMLITIATYGEVGPNNPYDWLDFWDDLYTGGVRVTPDWSTAYATYYSGGYGIWEEGHIGDRPIVTSYTESPAYEWYYDELCPRNTKNICDYAPGGHYGSNVSALPSVVLDGPSAFHQIQTMGILKGTKDLAVAQAWIEFTLTDDFQIHAARDLAVYPVVDTIDVSEVYGGVDPTPGSFEVADLSYEHIGANLDAWLDAWTDLCEQHDCA